MSEKQEHVAGNEAPRSDEARILAEILENTENDNLEELIDSKGFNPFQTGNFKKMAEQLESTRIVLPVGGTAETYSKAGYKIALVKDGQVAIFDYQGLAQQLGVEKEQLEGFLQDGGFEPAPSEVKAHPSRYSPAKFLGELK